MVQIELPAMFLAFILISAFPYVIHAAIYKCVIDGTLTFSDVGCPADSKEVKFQKRYYTVNKQQGVLDFRPMKSVSRVPFDPKEAEALLMKAINEDKDPAASFNMGIANIKLNHISPALIWFYKSAKQYYEQKDLEGLTACQLAVKKVDSNSPDLNKIDNMIAKLLG